jgi:Phospholipase_D-nuclease N-terminal
MTNALLAAGLHAAGGPSHVLWAALLPVIILAVLFDLYCLVDLIRARSVRRLPKGVWALVILLISAPWGGLAYLFLGRDRHKSTQQP